MCIDIYQSKRNNINVYLNGQHLYSESYSLPQMLSVCSVKVGDVVEVRFSCTGGESGTINTVGAILNDRAFQEAYDVLSASTWNLTEFSNTKISGNIQCNRDGLMYTSIPQNGSNWSVTVDGKKADIVLVGDCMIGVPLTVGNHQVTFAYNNSTFTVGLIISILSLIILIALWVLFYKPEFRFIKKLFLKKQ